MCIRSGFTKPCDGDDCTNVVTCRDEILCGDCWEALWAEGDDSTD